jgi:hypothetical protein
MQNIINSSRIIHHTQGRRMKTYMPRRKQMEIVPFDP